MARADPASAARNVTTSFQSSGKAGYSERLRSHPRRVEARKKIRDVAVQFVDSACTVATREGLVHAAPGDAIMTGPAGDRWRVSQARFADKYRPIGSTPPGASGRYESLPTRVMALQMQETFDVMLGDGVSRLHGQPGDWLVDYGDGSLGIVAQSIFAATYDIVTTPED